MTSISRTALLGEWIHSYEEDEPGLKVFRRSAYSFPPSRGRDAVELADDDTAIVRRPGPADVPEEEAGSWALDRETLRIDVGGEARVLEVVSCEGGRLEVRE